MHILGPYFLSQNSLYQFFIILFFPVTFFCFRHAHEAGMFTVPEVSASSHKAKDETEETSKPGVRRQTKDEQTEEQHEIDSAEEVTEIIELSSSSEDE